MAIYWKIVKNLDPLEKPSCEVCSPVVFSLGHIFMPSHPKAARISVYSGSWSEVSLETCPN